VSGIAVLCFVVEPRPPGLHKQFAVRPRRARQQFDMTSPFLPHAPPSTPQDLNIANVLAAHAVNSFAGTVLPGPGDREGFENQDAFMRAHQGTQINIAKNLDEADKMDPFPRDRSALEGANEQHAFHMQALLAQEDASEKRDMSATLSNWRDHRESLQNGVDYQDKMNGVLNENADRVGEMLVRHSKATTEAAEHAADEEDRANEIQLKRYSAGMEAQQSDLASQIVGLPDPGAPSEDEKALMKQNIMVCAQSLLHVFGVVLLFLCAFCLLLSSLELNENDG